jgi:hypothetical protein
LTANLNSQQKNRGQKNQARKRDDMNDCEHIAELLPWLLNGTLDEAERRQARQHLAQCPQCQQGLDETALALAVHRQHAPAEALVDYAFDRPAAGIEPELLRQHLDFCRECAELVEMARASRRWAERQEANAIPPAAEEKRRWREWLWPRLALATCLAGAVAFGAGLWMLWQSRNEQARLIAQQQEMRERVTSLEAENQQLRQDQAQQQEASRELAELQARVKELAGPQLNPPMFDLYPRELTRRADQSGINEIAAPRDAKFVTLILISQSQTASRDASLEIVNAQGVVVWRADGLTRHPTGDYTISLPAEFLPPGRYTLNLYDQGKGRRAAIASFALRLRRAAR